MAVWPPALAAPRWRGSTRARSRKIGLLARRTPDGRAERDACSGRARPCRTPARFLAPLAERVPLVLDPQALLTADELRARERSRTSARGWREPLDAELVESGVVVPYAQTRSGRCLLSERIDAANCRASIRCSGVDLANLCLR